MRARGLPHRIACLMAAFVITGCASTSTPQDIAERFWRAVIAQDPSQVRRYVRPADEDLLKDGLGLMAVTDFTLGRVVIDGDLATIDTHVTVRGERALELDLVTRLARENGQWRVDFAATAHAVSRHSELARLIDRIAQLGTQMRQGIDRSRSEIERVLPQLNAELSRLEQRIRQRVPALRQRLEEFAKQFKRRAPALTDERAHSI
jgi:hypothetical protein